MSSEIPDLTHGLPTEVVLHGATGALELAWGRTRARLEPAMLRSACRCAECEQERRAGRPVTSEDRVVSGVALTGLEPVGEHGLQLRFSDGHERGIYPWSYLRQLAQPQA